MSADRLIRPILITLILSWYATSTAAADDKCLTCHEALGGNNPVSLQAGCAFRKEHCLLGMPWRRFFDG